MKPSVKIPKRNKTSQSRCPTRRDSPGNALTNGLNSGSVLIPGDNVEAFRTLRRREFRLHKPRNIEEARNVETIVAGHWRIERCRVEQAIFKRHLGAVLSGDADVTGCFAGADPHRLHHRGTDCCKEERRLEKSVREAKESLRTLQRQRAENRIAGNETELEDYQVFLAEGEPVVEAEPREEGEIPAAASGSTDSNDGAILKSPNGASVAQAILLSQGKDHRQRAPEPRLGGGG